MIKPQYSNDNKLEKLKPGDIVITGIAPVARATYTATGARTLCTFTAFIRPLQLTILDLTLLHHDERKFSLSPLSSLDKTNTAKIRWLPGGAFEKAVSHAAGRAWNAMTAEQVKELRALYADKAKQA